MRSSQTALERARNKLRILISEEANALGKRASLENHIFSQICGHGRQRKGGPGQYVNSGARIPSS